MPETGYETKKKESANLWTLLKMFAVGLLVLAILVGIISVVESFSDSAGATDTANPDAGGDGTETDVVPTTTGTPETGRDIVHAEEMGKTGLYYSVSNLPQAISSEKRPDMNLVDVRIENNILKFSIVKNDDERFNNVRYNSVIYRVKVIAYRGEPWNREIEYTFLSDRSDRLDCFNIGKQSQDIEGDFYLIEHQSADFSSGEPKKTSCEIKQIWFYLE